MFNVSVSPDGRYIASGSPPRLTLWDTRSLRQVAVPLPLDVNAPDAPASRRGVGPRGGRTQAAMPAQPVT